MRRALLGGGKYLRCLYRREASGSIFAQLIVLRRGEPNGVGYTLPASVVGDLMRDLDRRDSAPRKGILHSRPSSHEHLLIAARLVEGTKLTTSGDKPGTKAGNSQTYTR